MKNGAQIPKTTVKPRQRCPPQRKKVLAPEATFSTTLVCLSSVAGNSVLDCCGEADIAPSGKGCGGVIKGTLFVWRGVRNALIKIGDRTTIQRSALPTSPSCRDIPTAKQPSAAEIAYSVYRSALRITSDITGAARLHRAESVWMDGLAACFRWTVTSTEVPLTIGLGTRGSSSSSSH